MRATFVAFDTETTGLEPESCEIIEIAGVKFRLDEVGAPVFLGQYTSLVEIDGSIPARASAINHIYDSMLMGQPKAPEAIGGFLKWVGPSAILLAHNAAFDVSFVGNAIYKYGLMLPKNPVFCTRRIACRLFPELRHRLADMEAHLISGNKDWLKIKDVNGQHRALYDSMMLMFVFAEMVKRRIPPEDWAAEKIVKVLPKLGGDKINFDQPLDSHALSQQYLNMEKERR